MALVLSFSFRCTVAKLLPILLNWIVRAGARRHGSCWVVASAIHDPDVCAVHPMDRAAFICLSCRSTTKTCVLQISSRAGSRRAAGHTPAINNEVGTA